LQNILIGQGDGRNRQGRWALDWRFENQGEIFGVEIDGLVQFMGGGSISRFNRFVGRARGLPWAGIADAVTGDALDLFDGAPGYQRQPGTNRGKGQGGFAAIQGLQGLGGVAAKDFRFFLAEELLVGRHIGVHAQEKDEHGHHQIGPGHCPMRRPRHDRHGERFVHQENGVTVRTSFDVLVIGRGAALAERVKKGSVCGLLTSDRE